MIYTPDYKRAALAEILARTPGNDCPTQCTRIRAALSQFSITTTEAGVNHRVGLYALGAAQVQQ